MANPVLSIEYLLLSELANKFLKGNAKRHDIGAISTSIRRYGFRDPLAIDATLNGGNGGIAEGNGRLEALLWLHQQGEKPPAYIKLTESGDWAVPCIIGGDSTTEAEGLAYSLDHNSLTMSGSEFTALDISQLYNPAEYIATLEKLAQAEALPVTVDGDDLDLLMAMAGGNGGSGQSDGDRDSRDLDEDSSEPPNDLFPSSNEWDIPDLDSAIQPTKTDVAWLKWGTTQRGSEHTGGIHFYTDDYKFNAVWSDPSKLLETGCTDVIEPNFSTWANMPRALAMTDIYKKRWLARYWQENGVRVWVDVNVSPHLHDLNFLGVPKEWRYFATRYLASFDDGNVAGIDAVMKDWEAIVEHTGTDECVLLVYGARPTTFQDCPEQWVLVLEHSDSIRGNYG